MKKNLKSDREPQDQEPQSLTPVFREATRDDLRQIRAVFKSSFKGQIPRRKMMNYRFFFAIAVSDTSFQFNVASLNNKVVGFSLTDRTTVPHAVHLDVIGVDPAVQGKDIGKGLLREVENFAKDSSLSKVHLEVRANNKSATGFYEKQGYHPVKTLEGYYKWDGVDAIVMEKQVATATQDNARRPARPPQIRR